MISKERVKVIIMLFILATGLLLWARTGAHAQEQVTVITCKAVS